jgi:hypothetical protein
MCGEHLAVPLRNRQRRSGGGKHADPDCGTGLTGRGTMVMPSLGFARTDDRSFRREEGPRASDKVSDALAGHARNLAETIQATAADVIAAEHTEAPAAIS